MIVLEYDKLKYIMKIEYKSFRLSIKNINELEKILKMKKKIVRKTTYNDVMTELIKLFKKNEN